MARPLVPDVTAAARMARMRQRRRAAAAADDPAAPLVELPPPELGDAPPGEAHVEAATAASDLRARRKIGVEAARAAYARALEGGAGALSSALVEKALGGDVSCLLAAARLVMPQPRQENRVRLAGLPALTDSASCEVARRRVAGAVLAGELDLADGKQVIEIVDRIDAAHQQRERAQALAELREALTKAAESPLGLRLEVLRERAAVLLGGGAGRAGVTLELVAQPEGLA